MRSDTLLQVFAKQPVAGEVKTRLIPALGEAGATEVYRLCLASVLTMAKDLPCDTELWLNRVAAHPLFSPFALRQQQGRDLGEKMFHALSQGLQRYQRVILIGTDCLELDQAQLESASAALEQHQLVICPAHDGGYVLIGASGSANQSWFEGIDWSTSRVLRQTLAQAARTDTDVHVMSPLRDIDHYSDLQHYAIFNQLIG